MAVTKIRGNDISAAGASIVDLKSSLSASTVSLPSAVPTKHGTLSVVNGLLTFSPGLAARKLALGSKVTETVSLNVTTETGSKSVQVTYTVVGVNDDPLAANDLLVLTGGKTKGQALAVLRNDSDIDAGDKLSVIGITNESGQAGVGVTNGFQVKTQHGVATVSAKGGVSFVLDAGRNHESRAFTDTLTYTVSDGKGGTATATIDIANNGGREAAGPNALDLIALQDTGISTTDNITNIERVTITGRAQPEQVVTLFNGDTQIGTVVATKSGNFSLEVVLAPGENRIMAKSVDDLGESLSSAPLVVTLDTTPPNAPSDLALADEDDTGFSAADGKTSKTSGLTLTGTADPDALVVIFEGGKRLASGRADATGQFAIDVSLLKGEHTLTARTTDAAGNLSEDTNAVSITVLVAPGNALKPFIASLGKPTNDTTPSLDITLGMALPDGARIEVLLAGVSLGFADGDGQAFTFTPEQALQEGTYAFTARVVDAAGNVGPLSAVRQIVVDTTPLGAAGRLDLVALHDTGRSSTDNITSKIDGLTLTAAVEAGVTADDLQIYEWHDDDGDGIVDAASELDVLVKGTDFDSASVSGGRAKLLKVLLSEGSHALLLSQRDQAGNVSALLAENVLSIEVDKTGPAAPTALALAAADDTGVLDSDAVTSRKTGLTITGLADAGSLVELYRLGANAAQVPLGSVLVDANGNFSVDISLPEGQNEIMARATDVAGNKGQVASLLVTVDTRSPDAPTGIDLASASDKGVSATDNITNLTSGITLTGRAESNAQVELFTMLNGAPATSLGKAVVSSSGEYTLDVELSEGINQITARTIDAAGNVSVASAPLKVVVDVSAPVAVSALNLLDADDTGLSSTDNITSQASGLTISAVVAAGTASGAVSFHEWRDVNLNGFVDAGETEQLTGVADAAVNGTSYVANLALQEGTHVLLATQKDVAGNESALDPVNAFTLVVDRAAPGQLVTLDAPVQQDADTVLVSGKLSARLGNGELVQIFDGITDKMLVGTASVAADGRSWSFAVDAGNAVKLLNISASVQDAAGNLGASSALLSLVVGTTGDDVITGTDQNDVIFGLAGLDRINAGNGDDFIDAGEGNDIISGENGNDTVKGGAGDDIVLGGADADSLFGDAGRDRLDGGLGDDVLTGGAGADILTGREGNDVFRVLSGDSALAPSTATSATVGDTSDVVTDFLKSADSISLGSLQVDLTDTASDSSYGNALSAAQSELRTAGDSSYQFVVESTTTGGNGLLGGGTTTSVTTGYLFINGDGAPGADQVIQLIGIGANADPA